MATSKTNPWARFGRATKKPISYDVENLTFLDGEPLLSFFHGIDLVTATPITAGVFVAGGPIAAAGAITGSLPYRRPWSQYQQWDTVGMYVVPNCTTPDELGGKALDIAGQMTIDIMLG